MTKAKTPAKPAAKKAAAPAAKKAAVKPDVVEGEWGEPEAAEPAPAPAPEPEQDDVVDEYEDDDFELEVAVIEAARAAFDGDKTKFNVMGGIYEMDREAGDKLKAAVAALGPK